MNLLNMGVMLRPYNVLKQPEMQNFQFGVAFTNTNLIDKKTISCIINKCVVDLMASTQGHRAQNDSYFIRRLL